MAEHWQNTPGAGFYAGQQGSDLFPNKLQMPCCLFQVCSNVTCYFIKRNLWLLVIEKIIM
ncbi:hypothetical protein E2986_10696 [Frieseomelitta varia]|uniref:Uncharacterized protein n=1 Tax=Frieseomelitta varia TaxID=561572 RepID=A0A833RM69_9HYME|nr:hypothetical protein E2986_10696 [Frieseomelitta varia]